MYLNMSQSSQLQLPKIMLAHVCVWKYTCMYPCKQVLRFAGSSYQRCSLNSKLNLRSQSVFDISSIFSLRSVVTILSNCVHTHTHILYSTRVQAYYTRRINQASSFELPALHELPCTPTKPQAACSLHATQLLALHAPATPHQPLLCWLASKISSTNTWKN